MKGWSRVITEYLFHLSNTFILIFFFIITFIAKYIIFIDEKITYQIIYYNLMLKIFTYGFMFQNPLTKYFATQHRTNGSLVLTEHYSKIIAILGD